MFYNYILLSSGVRVLCLKTYARFLHYSSVVYNNINAKGKPNEYSHTFAKISMRIYFITPKRLPYLSCLSYIAKTMNERDITSCKGCIKMMAGA